MTLIFSFKYWNIVDKHVPHIIGSLSHDLLLSTGSTLASVILGIGICCLLGSDHDSHPGYFL
jgi:hypothetical protein